MDDVLFKKKGSFCTLPKDLFDGMDLLALWELEDLGFHPVPWVRSSVTVSPLFAGVVFLPEDSREVYSVLPPLDDLGFELLSLPRGVLL